MSALFYCPACGQSHTGMHTCLGAQTFTGINPAQQSPPPTLRQRYAMAALPQLMRWQRANEADESVARKAFKYADAMLAAERETRT